MDETSEILNEVLERVAKEQRYDNHEITVKPISSGGANYTSILYLATISSPGKDDLKLFSKVAAISKKIRELTQNRVFEIESFFYNKLLKIYQEIEDKHEVSTEHRLMTPKFYATNDVLYREALVLEDLTQASYQAFDRFKSIDWNYASKSVQNLAKFHALSVAWSIADPDEFKKTERLMANLDVALFVEYMKNTINKAVGVTKPENKNRLTKFINAKIVIDEFMTYFKPLRRPVVCHGDYRPSNLLHKVHENGEVDIISIDYQTLMISNPIVDLMYFIFTGSDKQFRKHHLKATIEHYYSELCAALRRLDLEPDVVYSREDFDYEVDKVLPFGLIISMFCLLIVTVQEEAAPKFSEVNEITDIAFNPNDLYKERLNDIIDDFIDMGLL